MALWCTWLPCLLFASAPVVARAEPAVPAADHAEHARHEAAHAPQPAPPHEPAPPASHHECVMLHGALALRAVPDVLPAPQTLAALGAAPAIPQPDGGSWLQPSERESAATRRALLQVFLN